MLSLEGGAAAFAPILAAVALVLAGVVWIRPMAGVALLVVLPLLPGGSGDEGVALAHVTPADLAAVPITATIAVRALLLRRAERLRSWVVLPLAGVVLAAAVVTVFAHDPLLSLSGLGRNLELWVAVPIATYLALEERFDVGLLLTVVVAVGLLQAAIGVSQYLTETGASYQGRPVRGVGTFGAYAIMSYPAVVSAGLVAAVAMAATGYPWRRSASVLAALVLVAGVGVSLSRGYWMAALAGVLVVLLATHARRTVVLGAALVVGFTFVQGVGLLGPGEGTIAARASTISEAPSELDPSVRDRFALWEAATEIWDDHPVTGVGLKGFPAYRDTYAPLELSGASDVGDQRGFRRVALLSPDNYFLLVLAEQGVVGILALAAAALSLGSAGAKRLGEHRDARPARTLGLFGVAAFAVNLVSWLFSDVGGEASLVQAVTFGALVWWASGSGVSDVQERPA